VTERIVSLASFAGARHKAARQAALDGTLMGDLPCVVRDQEAEIKKLKFDLAAAQGLSSAAKTTSKYNIGELIRLREENAGAERSNARGIVLTASVMAMLWGVVDTILFGIHVEDMFTDIGSVVRFMLIFGPVCVRQRRSVHADLRPCVRVHWDSCLAGLHAGLPIG